MEPLQKKCLLVSAAAHAVLLGVLLVGSAFIKPPPPREIIPIKYFSGRLVDSVLNGGGGAPQMVRIPNPTPSPAPPAPAPQPAPTPPAPTPPKANPAPVNPKVEPAPKTTAKANPNPAPTPAKKPRINTTLTTRKSAEKSAAGKSSPASSSSRHAASQPNQRLQALERTMQSLSQGLTAGGLTISDVVGSGVGGGPGAVNYSQAVLGAYDDAWRPPPELEEDSAIAVARIIVHRSGRIVDARIIKRSGNHLMDLSVQNALEAVKELPPFPEGARDLERTFKIEFNLKVKRGLG